VGLHLLQFPLEILGCTLPWSLFLLGFASRAVRRSLGAARPQALFMALCVAFAFPTCWIPPEGQTRYFSPLYPCIAVLIGVVAHCCTRADVPSRLCLGWRRFAVLLASSTIAAAIAVLVAAFCLKDHPKFGAWAERLPIAFAYATTVMGLAAVIYKGRQAGDASRVRRTVLAVACFMVLTFTGILTNVRIRRSEDQAASVARLKEQLPPGQRLVSFGRIDSLFAYHYGVPIDLFSMPVHAVDLMTRDDFYFCFDSENGWRPPFPFAWREVGVVSMDRNRHAAPERAVVIGCTIPTNPYPIRILSVDSRESR
jgi:hypothetical protein